MPSRVYPVVTPSGRADGLAGRDPGHEGAPPKVVGPVAAAGDAGPIETDSLP